MRITNSDVKTIYFCPRKARFEIKGRKIDKEQFNERVDIFETETFGCTLIAVVDEIVSREPYVVKIRKSGKRVSEYHMLEAAFIGYVIESNGRSVENIIMESPFYSVFINWRPYVTKMLSLLSYFCENSEFRVIKTHLCRTCQYSGECFREVVEVEGLNFLHGVKGSSLEKLRSYGITNLKDVIKLNHIVEELFGQEKAKRVIAQAKSIIEQKPVVFKPLPGICDGIFLDIESYTPFNFDYLFGILDNNKYIPFLAEGVSSEREAFESTVEYIKNAGKIVYHFHNYEVTRFKKLSKKYNINLPKKFFENFVDVYKLYADHVALPVPSYSLKSIARFFGFNWRTSLNGQIVVRSYAEYLATSDKHILYEILIYNEDDVRATELILRKLREFSSQKN